MFVPSMPTARQRKLTRWRCTWIMGQTSEGLRNDEAHGAGWAFPEARAEIAAAASAGRMVSPSREYLSQHCYDSCRYAALPQARPFISGQFDLSGASRWSIRAVRCRRAFIVRLIRCRANRRVCF